MFGKRFAVSFQTRFTPSWVWSHHIYKSKPVPQDILENWENK